MIPAAFDYQRPASVDEALADARRRRRRDQGPRRRPEPAAAPQAAAGPRRHARRHRPADRAQGLRPDGRRRLRDRRIGDLCRRPRRDQLGWTAEAIEQIGDVQVRNRGTVAGSMAHCDPASDAPAISLALDYSVVLRSQRGERVVPLDELLRGPVPDRSSSPTSSSSSCAAVRCRPARAVPTASWPNRRPAIRSSGSRRSSRCSGGTISHARVALTGVGEKPYRAKAVEAALLGSDGSPGAVAAAAGHAIDGQTVNSDIHADRDYRSQHGRGLHPPRDRGRAGALGPPTERPRPTACRSIASVRVGACLPGWRAPSSRAT